MKIVKLNPEAIENLVNLIVESEPELIYDRSSEQSKQGTVKDELSDTKTELIKQVKENIDQMINDPDVGILVSLFIFLLTDKSSEYQIRRIGARYDEFLEGGGKETDFTRSVTNVLKPLTSKVLKSLTKFLDKEEVPELRQDVWEHILREEDNSSGREYYDLKASSTKNKIKQNAINRINSVINNPDLIRVFSMFLLYITDRQTASDLRAFGRTYNKKLSMLIDYNDVSWTQNLIKAISNTFKPLIEHMAEAVDKQLTDKQKSSEEKNGKSKDDYIQDKSNFNKIIQKYKF